VSQSPILPGQISDVDIYGVKQDGVALVDQIPVAGRRAIVDWAFGINEGLAAATEPEVFDLEKWRPKQDELDVITSVNNVNVCLLLLMVTAVICRQVQQQQTIDERLQVVVVTG
jgi:hypothetical protein